jgi:ferredoxin-NADP reductase
VPDLGQRDVYICGPSGFSQTVMSAARQLGVPKDRIHHEAFSF